MDTKVYCVGPNYESLCTSVSSVVFILPTSVMHMASRESDFPTVHFAMDYWYAKFPTVTEYVMLFTYVFKR